MNKNKICCIFGAGEYYGNENIPPYSYIIAADGGLNYLKDRGIKPDAVIGDFDSAGYVPEHENLIRLNPVKDDTDVVSSVRYAMKLGFSEYHIFGGTGGRTAHTISNIQTLAMITKKGARAFLYGNNERFTVLYNGVIRFQAGSEGYVSVFSLTEKSFGVYEKGLKYKLDNYTMTNDFPIGTSNEFTGNESEISVANGTLLIIYSDGALLSI